MSLYSKLQLSGKNPKKIGDDYLSFEEEYDGENVIVVVNAHTEEQLLVVDKPIVQLNEASRGIEVKYEDGEEDVYLKTGYWLSEISGGKKSSRNFNQDYSSKNERLVLESKGDNFLEVLSNDVPHTFTEIEFPAGIEYLDESLFENCSYARENVTKVDFTKAKDLETGGEAFTGFKKLEVIVLPKKANSVWHFKDCPKLVEIHINNLEYYNCEISCDKDKRIDIYASKVEKHYFTSDFVDDVKTLYVPSSSIAMLEELRDKKGLELDIKPLPSGYVFPKSALSKPIGGNSLALSNSNETGNTRPTREKTITKNAPKKNSQRTSVSREKVQDEFMDQSKSSNQRVTFDGITRGVFPLNFENIIKAIISLFIDK